MRGPSGLSEGFSVVGGFIELIQEEEVPVFAFVPFLLKVCSHASNGIQSFHKKVHVFRSQWDHIGSDHIQKPFGIVAKILQQ